MNRIVDMQQAGLRRAERALRKERDLDHKLMELLQKGMRAEAVEVLTQHLREVGELDRG